MTTSWLVVKYANFITFIQNIFLQLLRYEIDIFIRNARSINDHTESNLKLGFAFRYL